MMNNAVVQVVQGKTSKLLTFYCPCCKSRHTIAVCRNGEKLPLGFAANGASMSDRHSAYFMWNGSLDKPTLDGGGTCVAANPGKNCHVFINNGTAHGFARGYRVNSWVALKPVDEWPTLPPPPEEK